MNKNAEAWVKALRSGKYKQGRGALRTGDMYCCLGVACELAGAKAEKPDDLIGPYGYDGIFFTLPVSVQKWLGVKTGNGTYEVEHALSSDNDVGKTFEAIADIIKSEPEGLFA